MKKDRCKICKDRGYVNIRGRGSVGGWIRVTCPCAGQDSRSRAALAADLAEACF